MVLGARCGEYCDYKVRFANLQVTTNTHLLDSDDAVEFSNFSIVYMRDFEIDSAK
jgi:hypothetical protein